MAPRRCAALALLGGLCIARGGHRGPGPSWASLRGSNTTVTAASPPAANCSRHGDLYNCDADEKCKWCSWPGAASQCKEVAYAPGRLGSCSDQLTGCPGIRAAHSCTEEQGCQWCKSYTQGWEYCTDIANDESGVATCSAASTARAKGTVAARSSTSTSNSGSSSSSPTTTSPRSSGSSPGINCSRLSMFACGAHAECKWCMDGTALEFCIAIGDDKTDTVMCLTKDGYVYNTSKPDVQSQPTATTTFASMPGSNCSSHNAMHSCEANPSCQWCITHPDAASGYCRCTSSTSGSGLCTPESEVGGGACAEETTTAVLAEDAYEDADEDWEEEEEVEEEVATTSTATTLPGATTTRCEDQDMYSCEDTGLCKFCSKRTTGMGMCRDLSYDPERHESCGPPEVSCAGKSTADDCLADYTCQWCTAWTQGWTYCTDAFVNETSADCEVMGSDNILMF